uniref:carbonic anhydrase n=1 Tax=Poecilia mexicana TaxID=48701 RepID=A0A3B3XZK0_9TELE
MHNNGHTVIVELPEWMGLGGLPWFFTAVQLHLHWGNGGPGRGGSEHTINGRSSDAELHVVHYNAELYPNMSAAMTQRDGLAVLGILIETGDETNPGFNNILNYMSRIRHADQRAFIPAFDVQSLLPKDLGRYYRYNGSLTTPPCYQSVIWTMFHERVQISKAQLLKMEMMLYSSKIQEADRMLLQDNFRITQPLNHRVIFASFSAESGRELSSGEVTAIVIGVMCGCVGVAVIIRFIVKTIRNGGLHIVSLYCCQSPFNSANICQKRCSLSARKVEQCRRNLHQAPSSPRDSDFSGPERVGKVHQVSGRLQQAHAVVPPPR